MIHIKASSDECRRQVLVGVIPALFVPFLGAILYFVLLADSGWGKAAYTATKLFTLIWPVIAMLTIERRPIRWGRLDWPRHTRAIPLGVMFGIGSAALMLVAYHWTPLGQTVRNCGQGISEKTESLGIRDHFLLFGVFMSVGHSLLEEYYWRWFVFGRLRVVTRPAAAYLISGIAFAGHHYIILGSFLPAWVALLMGTCVGAVGIVWAWMYQRQRSLLGCWLAHLAADAIIIYVSIHAMT